MDLEKIVFGKRQPTRRGTILKNLLIIFIILVVLVVFVVIGLGQLGRAVNNEEYKEFSALVSKTYNVSDIVQFEIGGIDSANFKNKLSSSFDATNLYNGDTLNTQVLFNSAILTQEMTLDKKDLTILARAYLEYVIGLDAKAIAGVFEVQNISVDTNGNTTNLRLVTKISMSALGMGGGLDIGMLSSKDLPEFVYITFLGTIDNTKTMQKCLTSSNIIVNNLSSDENNKVLEFFLGKYSDELTIQDLLPLPIQYYLSTLHDIFNMWNARASFASGGITLSTI